MMRKSMKFRINRCDDQKRIGMSGCHSEEDIDEFIRDLHVTIYTIENQVDFNIYKGKPT